MPKNYPYSIIKVPEGTIPILVPSPCNPQLEVYSVRPNNHANLLFTIPAHTDDIQLDQSNRYRFIFHNSEKDLSWQFQYKIIFKTDSDDRIITQVTENGEGPKFYRNEIIFEYQ